MTVCKNQEAAVAGCSIGMALFSMALVGDSTLRTMNFLNLARVEECDGQLLVLNQLERALAAVDAVDGEARLVQLNAG